MPFSTLIFDFDGTIVDSGQLVYHTLVAFTGRTDLSFEALQCMPSDQVFTHLGIKTYQIPVLLLQIRHSFKKHLVHQPLVNGIAEVLYNLHSQGIKMHIVSSNAKKNITRLLNLHQLERYMDYVISHNAIFNKETAIRRLAKKIKHPVAYIGDETRDIVAAKRAGICSIAVSWGYNHATALASYNPDRLFNNPKDLLELISSVN